MRLSDSKIEDINNKLLASVNSQLYDAKKSIDEGGAKLAEAESQLNSQKEALEQKQQETSDQLGQASSGLTLAISGKTSEITSLQAEIGALKAVDPSGANPQVQAKIGQLVQKAQTVTGELEAYQKQLAEVQSGSITAATQFGSASAQLASAQQTIDSNKQQLTDARSQYESSREEALSKANVNALVDKETLAGIIKAQDFSMPAGYLDSGSDDQWLLRVGDNISSISDLSSLLLADIDGVGEIRLADVADITEVDNVGDQYMRINAKDGVLLSVFKNSTASTSEVSADTRAALTKIERPGVFHCAVHQLYFAVAAFGRASCRGGAHRFPSRLAPHAHHGFQHSLLSALRLGGDVLLGHLAEHYVAWRYFHRYWHAGR